MIRQVITLLFAIQAHCKMHKCPEYWVEIQGKCYFVIKEHNPFMAAAFHCSNKGGKLFEPETKVINDLVIQNEHIRSNYSHAWIGIHAPKTIEK